MRLKKIELDFMRAAKDTPGQTSDGLYRTLFFSGAMARFRLRKPGSSSAYIGRLIEAGYLETKPVTRYDNIHGTQEFDGYYLTDSGTTALEKAEIDADGARWWQWAYYWPLLIIFGLARIIFCHRTKPVAHA